MKVEMNITEKFELSNGITILACSNYSTKINIFGKRLHLIRGGEIRQTLTIFGERKMKNKTTNLNQRAFETNDTVRISTEEAQSGDWQLVSE
ncbi:MAG: hypothetical protein ACKE51_09420 [Methylococcaceae bacterium]